MTPAFISVDGIDAAELERKTYEVPFPLLSDPDLAAHEPFRVVNPLDEAGFERLKGFGLDIERFSGRKHHKLAIPSMFLIDGDMTVRWAHAAHDYRTRPPVSDVLTAVEAALKAP